MANEFLLPLEEMKGCEALVGIPIDVLLIVAVYDQPRLLCKGCQGSIQLFPPHNESFKKCSNEGCSAYMHGDDLEDVKQCYVKYINRCKHRECRAYVCAACASDIIKKARENGICKEGYVCDSCNARDDGPVIEPPD